MRARIAVTVVLASLLASCDLGSTGRTEPIGLYTGPINQAPESSGIWVWGDLFNQLCQQWSIAGVDQSGWFYGTNFPWSSVDVFVLRAPADPLEVVDAENFNYTSASVEASEGDTVFFRGRNGFFGAWTIDEIDGDRDAVLTGTWYYKAGGGGDFTSGPVDAGIGRHEPAQGVCDGF